MQSRGLRRRWYDINAWLGITGKITVSFSPKSRGGNSIFHTWVKEAPVTLLQRTLSQLARKHISSSSAFPNSYTPCQSFSLIRSARQQDAIPIAHLSPFHYTSAQLDCVRPKGLRAFEGMHTAQETEASIILGLSQTQL